jgi:DNA adenine methylase
MTVKIAHPFLKWAGGKTQLLPVLFKRAPSQFHAYHEPFLGGGALFFALRPKGRSYLSDINADLVRTYQVVRNDVNDLIKALQELAKGHSEQQYYTARGDHNCCKGTDVERAARFIYLNKTCFNGLYRVSKSGRFNVPIGKSKSPPAICDVDNLQACSEALQGVEINCRAWDAGDVSLSTGDFVYYDPPYAPVSKTANFTAYSKDGFGPSDQLRLLQRAAMSKTMGVHVLLSNAATTDMVEMYRKEGFKVEVVEARRSVNCNAAKRGVVGELLAW